MKSLLSVLILVAFIVSGCDNSHHRRKNRRKPQVPHSVAVTTYRVHIADAVDDSYIYWYSIYDSNTRSYYTASLPTQTSSYSTLNWSSAQVRPATLNNAEKISENEVELNEQELGEVAEEIESDYGDIPDDNSLDSMEGGGE